MVDVITPNEIFTVAEFCKLSQKIIKSAHDKKRLPVFIGGSMMYFKSLLDGITIYQKRIKIIEKS